MTRQINKILFAIFFLSGASGLIYQIVWIRLAFAKFGIILPVMSVAISVFMLGLALGSWFGGKYIDKLSQKFGISPVKFYIAAEMFIASGAFIVPKLFNVSSSLLLSAGSSNSAAYMVLSALFLAIALLPWCIAMGVTYPFMMSFIKAIGKGKDSSHSFSYLYTANVIGAVFGVIFTTVIWIEVLGFGKTLLIAGVFNLIAALFAYTLYKTYQNAAASSVSESESAETEKTSVAATGQSLSDRLIITILFFTGFVSLGLEVAWTRAFSPVLGTMVYAFAFLLAGYLFANWIGTSIYRRDIAKGVNRSKSFIVMLLAVFSFLPIVINDPQFFTHGDPNIAIDSIVILKYLVQILISIFPLCVVLGYLTPSLVDVYSKGNPKLAGKSYAINTVGCIIGPVATSYIMLPLFGVKATMIIFSFFFVMLFIISSKCLKPSIKNTGIFISVALIGFTAFFSRSYEVPKYKGEFFVKRDYAATVVAVNNKEDGVIMLVNGQGITTKTTITKMMAHLPMAFCGHKPESALVICFGMGTTFRALMTWDANVTAVELAPGTVEFFPVFYDDTKEILNNPKGKIVIDDGRRYLMRTKEKFDVITIDPPPPVQSSGSSLLYSREFYKLVKMRLKEGGILQQWIPGNEISGENSEYYYVSMARALAEEFQYVKAFVSVEGWGVHFIASMSPIEDLTPADLAARMPDKAVADFLEWSKPGQSAEDVFFLMSSYPLELITDSQNKKFGQSFIITDDTPYNEYYLLNFLFRYR